MTGLWLWIPITLLAIGLGIGIGYLIRQVLIKGSIQKEKEEAKRITQEALQSANDIEIKAKNQALEIRQSAESEIVRRRSELAKEEDRLQKRREELDIRTDRLEKREQALNKRQSAVDKRSNDVEKLYEQGLADLQRVAEMSVEEARQTLLAEVEKDNRMEMARIIRQIEAEAREEGERKARGIITTAIQRVASEHVADVASSVVPLPSDEMKGRIIGRNGRNIHAFEQVAGVDVIVDDTPESVTISCFDPVRREVARRTLEQLVLDGRIHPAHIEKIFKNEQKEVDHIILEAGEQAAFDAGVPGLHPEIIKTLGRLKFRTSYGQNQLSHAIETSNIAAVIAAEVGADIEVVKAGALLHDLGKAMDHNVEGTHAQIGADFAKRYGVNPKIVNAIASHHHEAEQESVEAAIVEAADAISGARPGARRESLEQYLKRVKSLEDIANSSKGVAQSYALQAGREIRIFVRPEEIDDLESIHLARDIAKKIEESMQYPGQIKVTVIRETRSIDFAK